jgi:serine/threonine-protein kinase
LLRGHVPEREPFARPLTKLAALAIAARDNGEPVDQRGVVLEPYRTYRGVVLIGAWQWLPEHDFAVATEIEATEALAPLRYLNVTFGVLFVLLRGFVAATLAFSFYVARLRRRVRKLMR